MIAPEFVIGLALLDWYDSYDWYFWHASWFPARSTLFWSCADWTDTAESIVLPTRHNPPGTSIGMSFPNHILMTASFWNQQTTFTSQPPVLMGVFLASEHLIFNEMSSFLIFAFLKSISLKTRSFFQTKFYCCFWPCFANTFSCLTWSFIEIKTFLNKTIFESSVQNYQHI